MTWVGLLHRYTLRGDLILVGHALGFTALYLVLGASALSRIALKTSVEICAIYTTTLILITLVYRLSPWHPLTPYPGPLLAKTTSLWLTYISSTGKRYLILDALHARYGPFLRIGTPLRAPESTLTWLMLTARRAKRSIHQLPKRRAALHQRREERDVPVSRPPRRDGPVLQAGQRRRASRAETRVGSHVRARGVCTFPPIVICDSAPVSEMSVSLQRRGSRTSARTKDRAAVEDSGVAAGSDGEGLLGLVRGDVPLGA